MSGRHALLIGVPTYGAGLFSPLTGTVEADLDRMAGALEESDYQVTFCAPGRDGCVQPTRGAVQNALLNACRDAPEDGVLLIYFTGHGVMLDGKSFLVPSDVYPDVDDEGTPDEGSLIPLVPRALERCRAKLVVLIVDACRDTPGESGPISVGGQLRYPPDGAFALVTSCKPGETSGYDESGSYFTQTLSEILARRNSARTLPEVFAETGQQLARRMAHTDSPTQTAQITWAEPDRARDLPVCEGDQISTAWRRAIESTPLWNRAVCSDADTARVREAVIRVVETCADDCMRATDVLAKRAHLADPWSSHGYPTRILDALDLCLAGDARLTAREIGLLVAVPFLREAVMAAGVREAAAIGPTDFERHFSEGLRDDLELTHAMHEHVCRRAEGLVRRGRADARDALAMWLVHRWLVARPRLWDGPAAQEVSGRLATALPDARGTAGLTARELADVARVLMHAVGTGADDQRLTERLAGHDFTSQRRSLAVLLALAGTMALDTRRMPTVVVDHLGIGDELQISALRRAVELASWERAGDTLDLVAICDHPAIHEALDHIAQRAEHARESLLGLPGLDTALLRAVPDRLSQTGLRPEYRDGKAVYETPLLAFRLSDEKIRELLMGRQLYGDPSLAIRELYQNALDACRYRRTRRRYRDLRGHPPLPWEGRITFKQDVDPETGREYIECRDNGVGMTVESLKNTFANAGERFVYRQDFRYEQARWQEKDPSLRLIPNSQFGIGVFSYFMIADEIEITTRAVDEEDQVRGPGHRVRIASSGSLFQITAAPYDEPGGGTCVRLYLTGDEGISVLRTMRQLLWHSEFHVEVEQGADGSEQWLPETLRHPETTVEPLQHGRDLWWVAGEGGIVADGIRTNEEIYGLVVNLRGKHRPRFTVDRNTLQDWDKDWITAEIRESLPALREWAGFSLTWLWGVTESAPEIAQEIFTRLAKDDVAIPLGGQWTQSESVSARLIGCLPLDERILSRQTFLPSNDWLHSWRMGAWQTTGTVTSRYQLIMQNPAGAPVAEPCDAAIIDELFPNYNNAEAIELDRIPRIAARTEGDPVSDLKRLRRLAVLGLDCSQIRGIPHLRRGLSKEDQPLSHALTVWSPESTARPWRVVWQLAETSAQLKISVRHVLRRVEGYAPGAAGTLDFDLSPMLDHTFSTAEVRLLRTRPEDVKQETGWRVTPREVAKVSSWLALPLASVLEMYDAFSALGCRVEGRTSYPASLTTAEMDALQFVREFGMRLSPIDLFALAAEKGVSARAYADQLRRLTDTGFLLLPEHSLIPEDPADEVETELLRNAYVARILRDQGVSYIGKSPWNILHAVLSKIGHHDSPGFARRFTQYRRILDLADLRVPLTAPGVLGMASSLSCTVSEAIAHYRVFFPETADLSLLPDAAAESDLRCHGYQELSAMTGSRAEHLRGYPSWRLTPWHLANSAYQSHLTLQEFIRLLEPFRALGAPIPVLDEAVSGSLDGYAPDKYDRAILTVSNDEFAVAEPITDVDALRLVKTAGRYGWTLREAHDRFARFQPLGLTLSYPEDAVPDGIVYWQDLLAITDWLDGQPPVVSGVVGADHVARAAKDLEEDEETVRGRLRKYQGLFGYRMEGEG
ncbi:caspase domain-containing protein [Actinocorallia herbida]|uniref:Caspase domain-containing protein n=1 Tax=Actinocorallia herbida TaxID=58109 RepID=A0A3N1D4S5_9ACTN|nr:caspase family protein [Actinocorallia herbida]ROO88542.1 caspase domain-containing protein [Actinocorallia herbida]